ncbi:MAG: S8 family serine peptidase [Gammaproteobacteria bacterium]
MSMKATAYSLRTLTLLSLCTTSLYAAPVTSAPGFSAKDRTLLAEYRVLERPVPLIMAVQPEAIDDVVTQLTGIGAEILDLRRGVGYMFAKVPLDNVSKVPGVRGLVALQVGVNPVRAEMSNVDPQVKQNPAEPYAAGLGVPPTRDLARNNPYTAEEATQALTFKSKHPDFDGRGVTIGLVERMPLNMSSLTGALDISGAPLPKFRFFNVTQPAGADPSVSDSPSTWQMTDIVATDSTGAFTWQGKKYQLPRTEQANAGTWRICRRLGGNSIGALDASYELLWLAERQQVWVLPTSSGTDFSNGKIVDLTNPVAWTVVGDEKTGDVLVVNVDRERHWLSVLSAGSSHGAMVASVMAGSHLLGSKADGVSPASQLAVAYSKRGSYAPGLYGYDRLLTVIEDSRVDVAQASMSFGDTVGLGGLAPQAWLANHAVEKSGKPIVMAAENSGGQLFGGMTGFSGAEKVFAVGAYTPPETWRVNMGFTPSRDEPTGYSSYGPAKDGGLKPDFLALTGTLAEFGFGYGTDMGKDTSWHWKDIPGHEGYGVSGGTSASAPNGAGLIALLVSAARQSRIPYDADRLRAAIATTSKFLKGVEARAQGHGLMQVNDAWAALQRAKRWTPPAISVAAPLVEAESRPEGPVHTTGRGLLELSGWHPGASGHRNITLTRTAGDVGNVRYQLRWKSNTTAFGSKSRSVVLPLGQSVSLPVDISVGPSGSYSAIMDLVDSRVNLVAGSVMLTVMVADPLPADGKPLEYKAESPQPGNTLFYVDVPRGLKDMSVFIQKGDGRSLWIAQDPTGRRMPFELSRYGSENYKGVNDLVSKKELRLDHHDPLPGVWQFWLSNMVPSKLSDMQAVKNWGKPKPVSVSIRGWDIHSTVTSRKLAQKPAAEVVFESNRLAGDPTVVKAVGVGATRVKRVKLVPGLTPTILDVTIEKGTQKFSAQMRRLGAQGRVGLYVFKVPGDEQRKQYTLIGDWTALADYDSSFRPTKNFTLADPVPGEYRVVLDPLDVPEEGVEVEYQDTIYQSGYGSVTAVDSSGASSSTKAMFSATTRGKPPEGRELIGEAGLFERAQNGQEVLLDTATWPVDQSAQ